VLHRRFAESTAEKLTAEKACAHWGEGKDDCVLDVMTTGDLEMAVGVPTIENEEYENGGIFLLWRLIITFARVAAVVNLTNI
jgi:hypothetical protein